MTPLLNSWHETINNTYVELLGTDCPSVNMCTSSICTRKDDHTENNVLLTVR